MNHGVKINKLGRNAAHRKALMRNLASHLFVHGSLLTTEAKAKALRPYAEKIITKAVKVLRADKVPQRLALIRNIAAEIQLQEAYDCLTKVWAVSCMNRPGGYTRIIKLNYPRKGDASNMAFIAMVMDGTAENPYAGDFKGAKHQLLQTYPIVPHKLMQLWAVSRMPLFELTSTFDRARSILRFSISLKGVESPDEMNWPIYNGQYTNLPLTVDIDCSHLEALQIETTSSIKLQMRSPGRNAYQFNISFSELKQLPVITGSIKLKQAGKYLLKNLSWLHYCELIIYGPPGRLYSANLLQVSTKTKR